MGTELVESGSGSLADRLRLGSLTEDGLGYKEKFIVRCYEVGINKTVTIETIANFLQVFFFFFLSSFQNLGFKFQVDFICLHAFRVFEFRVLANKKLGF